MTPRQKLIARVQALLSKTIENGCTEGEALSALTKARELMAAHDVADTDLEFGGETVTQENRYREDWHRFRQSIALGVGAFCSCQVWRQPVDQIVFCGLQSDAIFAHWLLDTLADNAERNLSDYLAATWTRYATPKRRREVASFVTGFCNRLNERLKDLAPASTALTVRKNELVRAAVDGMRFKSRRGRYLAIDDDAIRAGQAAGNSAQFNKPVEGSSGPIKLLGKVTP